MGPFFEAQREVTHAIAARARGGTIVPDLDLIRMLSPLGVGGLLACVIFINLARMLDRGARPAESDPRTMKLLFDSLDAFLGEVREAKVAVSAVHPNTCGCGETGGA